MTMEEGARLDRDEKGRANGRGRPAMSEPPEAWRDRPGIAVQRGVAAAGGVAEESASRAPESFREEIGGH